MTYNGLRKSRAAYFIYKHNMILLIYYYFTIAIAIL